MAAKEEQAKVEEEPKKEEAEAKVEEEPKKEEAEAKEETKDEPMEEVKEEAKEEVKDEPMDEVKEEAKEEVKEEEQEEEAKELEEDAPVDSRPKLTAPATWSSSDSTINVLKVANGNVLMSVTEGGCQYLLAGVRATAGVKSGRYMFELQILETLYPWEPQGSQGRTPAPKNLVRVGVSSAESSLFLADTVDSVCFDSEGYFFQGKKRSKVSEKFSKSHTVALLINLDEKSPNANTVSLFKDGRRVSQPQKLPENLQGKVLYPTITYKNVTLRVNLGPAPLAALPFSCSMLSAAAAADAEVAAPVKDGPCEVIFPVGLPDQGVFDYVDVFLEQNSKHMELSDRQILEWSNKSGIWRPKGYAQRSSNDKPDMNFGIPLMDDLSVNGVVQALAPAVKRDYVVMELRGNLLADERKKALARFSGPAYKRKAVILMGEPPEAYKQKVQALMLEEKKASIESEKRKKLAEEERNRLWEEKKKKAEEARKSREGKKNGGDEEEKKDDDAMETEEKKEEEKEEEPSAPVELTDDEKKLWYRKSSTPDLSQEHLGKSYASFTLPTAEEGFDDISYVWQPKDKVETYLREWLLEQKRTQRAEDLEPSAWFKGEYEKWKKALMDWKKKQNDFRDPVKRKYALKKKEEEAKKAKAEEKEGEAAEADKEDKEEEAKPETKDIIAEDVEVDAVEDVADIGTGEPLFSNFVYEDWTLVAMRFELHLLIHAFRKDLNDPDRPSFQEAHLAYYYDKYYGKSFTLKNFGVEKMEDFLEMVEDSIGMAEGSGMLEAKLAEDTALPQFIRLAEEHRRDRARRVDAGDETAQLKFKKPAPPPPRQPTRSERDDKGSKSKGSDRRGSDKGKGGGGGGNSRPTYSGGGSGGGHSSTPPSRYGGSSSRGGDRDSYSRGGSGGGGGGSSYGSEKRSYGTSSSYPPQKSARTSSYSGGGGGHGKADSRSYSSSGKGGSSSYNYRR